ncbi:MBL fold metallo-hydrolase [Anaerolineales bacterium]
MILRYFYDKSLAQASYMVACAATGEALIIDPARDISVYLEAAQDEGLRITQVTETHIHADFVSGLRELGEVTGAQVYVSGEGGEDWQYLFGSDQSILLHHGDTWMLGNIKIEVIHSPGHTPESISFMITDTAGADAPIGIFTGDFLFVGDVGRPDLLEEAAGIMNTREPGARQQFQNVQYFKGLPDYLQIWPAHGAGSACGKALGAVPSTTLGYEKRFNPAFQFENEDTFVEWLLMDQPEAPRYFGQMKKVNKEGPALIQDLAMPVAISQDEMQGFIEQGQLVIDTRSLSAFREGHLKGSLNIPASAGGFTTYVGWYVDYQAPLYLIAEAGQMEMVVRALRSIGIDHVPSYVEVEALKGDLASLSVISVAELAELRKENPVRIIDVRGKTEFRSGHIEGAENIPMGYLRNHFSEIPKDALIVTQCASGLRSQIAASVFQAAGFRNVKNLEGGIEAWERQGLPMRVASVERVGE